MLRDLFKVNHLVRNAIFVGRGEEVEKVFAEFAKFGNPDSTLVLLCDWSDFAPGRYAALKKKLSVVKDFTYDFFVFPENSTEEEQAGFFRCLATLRAYRVRWKAPASLAEGSAAWMKEYLVDCFDLDFYLIFHESFGMARAFVKRGFDMVCSFLGLLLLIPFFAYCAIRIKLDSAGPVFYSQERIGRKGKKFRIYKFRSMRLGAEEDTPRLATENDKRVTPWGRIMRRYRIDELPQLWNVLKGDMSFIGYRPEREYYIKQIRERVPFYSLLYSIRPGISSQGMVKFGYAENVDEMVDRLGEDMDYLYFCSLKKDCKLIADTLRVVFHGEGK